MGILFRVSLSQLLIEDIYSRLMRDGPGLSAVGFRLMALMLLVRDCTA
jgi:hypothetical protein